MYRGRFAPSPTGPLHAGSLVAALASWLDARALGGRWLVRIEDVDTSRCMAGMGSVILHQLAALGLTPDEAPTYQSRQLPRYRDALAQLQAAALTYPCRCSRKDIEATLGALGQLRPRTTDRVYPGTCRPPAVVKASANPCAWRMRTDAGHTKPVEWQDRRLGPQQQHVESQVGDFALLRADGCFTYQLAAVVDDAADGITHVVRGEDLADNTARQILLQQALGLPRPQYLHVPLVVGPDGEKLSKQKGAAALEVIRPLPTLNAAALTLGLHATASGHTADVLSGWVEQWRQLYNQARD